MAEPIPRMIPDVDEELWYITKKTTTTKPLICVYSMMLIVTDTSHDYITNMWKDCTNVFGAMKSLPLCYGLHGTTGRFSWWRHGMDTLSALLTICKGNHRLPVVSHRNPVSDDFFIVIPNNWLNAVTLMWRHHNILLFFRALHGEQSKVRIMELLSKTGAPRGPDLHVHLLPGLLELRIQAPRG